MLSELETQLQDVMLRDQFRFRRQFEGSGAPRNLRTLDFVDRFEDLELREASEPRCLRLFQGSRALRTFGASISLALST